MRDWWCEGDFAQATSSSERFGVSQVMCRGMLVSVPERHVSVRPSSNKLLLCDTISSPRWLSSPPHSASNPHQTAAGPPTDATPADSVSHRLPRSIATTCARSGSPGPSTLATPTSPPEAAPPRLKPLPSTSRERSIWVRRLAVCSRWTSPPAPNAGHTIPKRRATKATAISPTAVSPRGSRPPAVGASTLPLSTRG